MTAIGWMKRNDRWVPGIIVAGFLVVFAVNAAMVWIALGSFDGLEATDYYQRGLAYNQTLAIARNVAGTGWKADVTAAPAGGGRYAVAATVTDRAGKALAGARVMAKFVRPANSDADFSLPLAADRDVWRGETGAIPAGLWQVRLFVTRGKQRYATEVRLVLP